MTRISFLPSMSILTYRRAFNPGDRFRNCTASSSRNGNYVRPNQQMQLTNCREC